MVLVGQIGGGAPTYSKGKVRDVIQAGVLKFQLIHLEHESWRGKVLLSEQALERTKRNCLGGVKYNEIGKVALEWTASDLRPSSNRIWVKTGNEVLPAVVSWEEMGRLARDFRMELPDLAVFILKLENNRLSATTEKKDTRELSCADWRRQIGDYLFSSGPRPKGRYCAEIFEGKRVRLPNKNGGMIEVDIREEGNIPPQSACYIDFGYIPFRASDFNLGACAEELSAAQKAYRKLYNFLSDRGIGENSTADQFAGIFNLLVKIPNLIAVLDNGGDIEVPQKLLGTEEDNDIEKNKRKLMRIFPRTLEKGEEWLSRDSCQLVISRNTIRYERGSWKTALRCHLLELIDAKAGTAKAVLAGPSEGERMSKNQESAFLQAWLFNPKPAKDKELLKTKVVRRTIMKNGELTLTQNKGEPYVLRGLKEVREKLMAEDGTAEVKILLSDEINDEKSVKIARLYPPSIDPLKYPESLLAVFSLPQDKRAGIRIEWKIPRSL